MLPELCPDQAAQRGAEGFVIDLREHLLEKAEDEQFARRRRGDAAGFEVEHLFCVNVAAGGAVCAADVIGLDLKPGQRVAFGIVAEEKVPVALVGVGLLGVRIDDDQAGEDRARAVEERVLVEQIGSGAGRLMALQGALVELLLAPVPP